MNELAAGILMAEYDVIFYEDAYFEGLLYNWITMPNILFF